MKSIHRNLSIITAIFTSFFIVADVSSFSHLDNLCPDRFLGRVETIEEPTPPLHLLSKLRVKFVVLEHFSGDIVSEVEIELLKHGPIVLDLHELYRVQLRNGLICSLVKF